MAEMAGTESSVLQERKENSERAERPEIVAHRERKEIVDTREKVGLKDNTDIKENQDRKVTTDIRGFVDYQEQQGCRASRTTRNNRGPGTSGC